MIFLASLDTAEMRIAILTVIGIVFFITVAASLCCILDNNGKSSENDNELKYPKSFRLIPLLIAMVFVIGAVIAMIIIPEVWLIILILSLIIEIPMLLLFAVFSLWTIVVYEDRVVYRNYIGIKKTYLFKEIEQRQDFDKWYSKKTDKKIFSVPHFIPNARLLKRGYKKYCLKLDID